MQATLMNRQTFRKNIGFAPAARSAAAAAVLAAGMASAPAASNSPFIYSISPSSGSPINPNISPLSSGTKIIITGKNFTPESAIHFCGGTSTPGLNWFLRRVATIRQSHSYYLRSLLARCVLVSIRAQHLRTVFRLEGAMSVS